MALLAPGQPGPARAVAAGRALARSRRSGTAASPIASRAFALSLVAAVAVSGWLACPFTLTAAFGVAWFPSYPPVPAVMILDGMMVAIDPGHGGWDDGVLLNEDSPDEVKESDINLAVGLKLRDILERVGASVAMTRTTDTDLVQPGDEDLYGSEVRASLTRRAEVANAAGANVLISLHCNGYPEARWRGAQTFYLAGDDASRLLAESIQQELVRLTRETDREANWREGLFILKQAKMPATIVELGFLSNPRDCELLRNPDYQRLCALAIFFGLARFTRLTPAGPS